MENSENGIVCINISGNKFEISSETWNAMISCDSQAAKELERNSDPSCKKQEYFLERHPGCFPMIMGYFQNRGLHMPPSVCPSEFKAELDYWGIDPVVMNKCCFGRYIGFFDDQNVLTILEKDQTKRLDERNDLEKRQEIKGWTGFQAKAWLFLEEPSSSVMAKVYFVVSSLCVIISIFGLVSGTHKSFKRPLNEAEWRDYFQDEFYKYKDHFDGSPVTNATLPLPQKVSSHLDFLKYIEYITVAYFTIELIIRIIFCPYKKNFLLSFLNWVDIFALFVMYSIYVVNLSNPKEKYRASVFDIVHCLQIVRVFRLFRLVRNFTGFKVLLYSIKASAMEVMLMSMFLVVAMLMFGAFAFFSGDTAFTSIPDAFWWAIVTMTTVGYGDVYPTIGLSKFVGGICAITGVCLLAVIIPIFVNNFLMFYTYSKVWGGKQQAKKLNSASDIDTEKKNVSRPTSSKCRITPVC